MVDNYKKVIINGVGNSKHAYKHSLQMQSNIMIMESDVTTPNDIMTPGYIKTPNAAANL